MYFYLKDPLYGSDPGHLLRKLQLKVFFFILKGSRKKKVLLLMAGPLRPNPPPPLELNGR